MKLYNNDYSHVGHTISFYFVFNDVNQNYQIYMIDPQVGNMIDLNSTAYTEWYNTLASIYNFFDTIWLKSGVATEILKNPFGVVYDIVSYTNENYGGADEELELERKSKT